MATREVHLERLVGRCVRDAAGKSVGRIEEVIAEQQGAEWVVREYLIGSGAFLARLSALDIGRALLRFLQRNGHSGYRVPWDKLNLTDLHNPRLHCSPQELEPIPCSAQKKLKSEKR